MDLQQPAIALGVLERIERFVRSRTSGMILDLQVEEREGRVIIQGRAATYYVKQLATQGALAADTGVDLDNEVEVQV